MSGRRLGLDKIELDVPIGALKTQLSKLLLSFDRVGWQRNATAGRFDQRKITRLMAGSERVFRKRTEDKAVTTAVSIVVDLSSSMSFTEEVHKNINYSWRYSDDHAKREEYRRLQQENMGNSRIRNAAKTAWILAQCIERVGCDVEVTGFTDGTMNNLSGLSAIDDDVSADYNSYGCGYTSGKALMFKPWNVKLAAVRDIFESMDKVCDGGTPDYHVVRSVTERVAESGANRRLVIVVTDGQGSPELMKEFSRYADERLNTLVIGIGIGSSDATMSRSYDYFACVKNIADLASGSLATLIKLVRDRDEAVLAGRKPKRSSDEFDKKREAELAEEKKKAEAAKQRIREVLV